MTDWRISITRVTDWARTANQGHFYTEIAGDLDANRTSASAEVALPRAGQKYWLIDERTFNHLRGIEAE